MLDNESCINFSIFEILLPTQQLNYKKANIFMIKFPKYSTTYITHLNIKDKFVVIDSRWNPWWNQENKNWFNIPPDVQCNKM